MRTAPAKIFFMTGSILFVASLLVVGVGHAELQFIHLFSSGSSADVDSGGSMASVTGERVIRPEDEIIEAVKRSEPAVASVIITKDVPKLEIIDGSGADGSGVPFPGDPFFRQFRLQAPRYRQNGTEKRDVGGGTAFFVSEDGLLLTNRHVVHDEQAEYAVLLNDGTRMQARVVGRDPGTDIALLKVVRRSSSFLIIASADDLHLGQTAIAIGNSLGEFSNTVSVGVISGLRRSITAGDAASGDIEHLDQIIQTDAAINQGNSGGPLLNSRGEVIGMNTAVAGEGQNIGFALPAAELRRVLESYRKNGRIVRVYLGVRYMPLTSQLRAQLRMPYEYGVLVARGETIADVAVIPGSPADKAGIRSDDIILEADGKQLTADVSLKQIVASKSSGDALQLRIVSGGEEKELSVILEELQE